MRPHMAQALGVRAARQLRRADAMAGVEEWEPTSILLPPECLYSDSAEQYICLAAAVAVLMSSPAVVQYLSHEEFPSEARPDSLFVVLRVRVCCPRLRDSAG